MPSTDYYTLIISIVALLSSAYSVYASNRNARIALIHSMHELVLQKAKDCNNLFEISLNTHLLSQYELRTGVKTIDTISEITISIQLIDRALKEYSVIKSRPFFLQQFWTQLNTTLRLYIKNGSFPSFPKETQDQISVISNTFKGF